MAGTAADYLRTKVLGHTLGYAAYAMPAPAWVGLTTTQPSPTIGGTEVAGSAYARQHGAYGLIAGHTDMAANTATLEWLPATAPWGTVGWFELWDAATAGNRLYWGALVDPTDGVTPITVTVGVGDIMRIQAGALIVQAI